MTSKQRPLPSCTSSSRRSPRPSTPPQIVYSCEICGQDLHSENHMKHHVKTTHLEDTTATTTNSTEEASSAIILPLHKRDDVDFLEDLQMDSDFDSIWQLERGAKEGLTSGIDESPTEDHHHHQASGGPIKLTSGNGGCCPVIGSVPIETAKIDSPMSTSTEVSETTSSCSPIHTSISTSSATNNGAIQKRIRTCPPNNESISSPSKNGLTLNIKPSWMSSPKIQLHQCPMCDHQSQEPSKLQEHVNRVHFDPQSPRAPASSSAASNSTGTVNSQESVATAARGQKTPSTLPCPLCVAHYATSLELERHVNTDHSDILSPLVTQKSEKTSTTVSNNDSNGNGSQQNCPVCNQGGFQNQNDLAEHTDSHFNLSGPPASTSSKLLSRIGNVDGQSISSMSSSSSTSSSSTGNHNQRHNDFLLAQELERRERERLKFEEKKEFDQLRAQFGMDNDGNFHTQSISNMQNAVYRGEMSVVDYYERQSDLKQAEKNGMDDGRSQTRHLMPKLKILCQNAQGVSQTFLSSVVDHHSSSYGDKGWGCGYRNLQMLISSLAHHSIFSERLGITKGAGVPSISRLQGLIEEAWAKGYDVQGCEQLGKKLVNTRKWIGATEIVAFLTSHNVKTELLDFHIPSAKDGTHPKLFQWVVDYFRERARAKAFTPPLYLQHQGHSRTIVGIEVLTSGGSNNLRLLIFDPSHSRSHMTSLLKCSPSSSEAAQVMRMLRKGPQAMKCKQYQIVAVTGVFANQQESALHKVIQSKRIP